MATNLTERIIFPSFQLPRELRNLVYRHFWGSLHADGVECFCYPLNSDIYHIDMRPSIQEIRHSLANFSEYGSLPRSILANSQIGDEAMQQLLLHSRVETGDCGIDRGQQRYTVDIFNLLAHLEELYFKVPMWLTKTTPRLMLEASQGSLMRFVRLGRLLYFQRALNLRSYGYTAEWMLSGKMELVFLRLIR